MTTNDHVGSDNRYKSGCRCTDCKQAHRNYEHARRRTALANGNLTHGRRATYDAGCRCEAYRATRSVASAREWAGRAAS